MIKRIKYISRFATDLTDDDIDDLVSQAARNNAELDITGVLMCSGSMFFQIIEGPPDHVDLVFRSILGDRRHTNVLLVNAEEGLEYRLFPGWPLEKLDLGLETDVRLEPLRLILETVIESRTHLERLTGSLERAIWNEVGAQEMAHETLRV